MRKSAKDEAKAGADSFPATLPVAQDVHPEFVSIVESRADAAVAQERPFFVQVSGVPGAGKSSMLEALVKQMGAHAPSVVAFDRLMESVPAYRAEADREKAFRLFEVPAREAGYLLIKRLMAKKSNIVFEHSGAHEAHVDLLRYAREIGYRVMMIRLNAPLDVVRKRVAERQKVDGRHVPSGYIDERAAKIESLIGHYRALAHDFVEIENADVGEESRTAFLAESARKIADRFR